MRLAIDSIYISLAFLGFWLDALARTSAYCKELTCASARVPSMSQTGAAAVVLPVRDSNFISIESRCNVGAGGQLTRAHASLCCPP